MTETKRCSKCGEEKPLPTVGKRGAQYVVITCEVCGAKVRRLKSKVDWNRTHAGYSPRYCSVKCRGISLRIEHHNPRGPDKTPRHRPLRFPQLHDRDWLWQRIVVEDKTAREIATEIGCTPAWVRVAIRKYGIPALPQKIRFDTLVRVPGPGDPVQKVPLKVALAIARRAGEKA